MNVLIVSHLFPNPAEPLKGVFVRELALAQAAHCRVEVVAPVSWFPLLRSRRGVPRHLELRGVRVHHPRYLAAPAVLFGLRWKAYSRAFSRVSLRIAKPDVVHAHWVYPDARAAWSWSEARDAHKVITIHGHAGAGLELPLRFRPHHFHALAGADRIITVSDQLKERLKADYSVPDDRVSVIHNGVDPGLFFAGPQEMARRKLGIPLNKRVVICVARLATEKRLDDLVMAMAGCRQHDWQLYVLGEGPMKSQIEATRNGLGLENRVFLPGGVGHELLPDWYRAADLFCLSSAHEGCPVVVHEALACGLPIVSTRVGAVPDLLSGPEFGRLTPVGDVPALTREIEAALSQTWDRDVVARHGARFTWDSVARDTLQCYRGGQT